MRSIFITGGAGFLGTHLIRAFSASDPQVTFTIYSRDEAKHTKVRSEFPQARFILGDVRDLDRLRLAMTGHDTVIHCAALKYVPEAERNVEQAIAVNVDGSRNVAQAAILSGVERVVGISTDKACEPINVYGMTKSLMERIFQEADAMSDTQFNLVRYGNVIASTGSVIPLFVKQIRHEGKVTLSAGDMTRFWLTIDAAVNLVRIALDDTHPATILIPRLASIRNDDLLKAILAALGYDDRAPDLDIVPIGNRGGEKVHERLLSRYEAHATWQDRFTGDMRLFPLTSEVIESRGMMGPMETAYGSESPDEVLTVEKMAAWIRELLLEMEVTS